MNDSLIGKTVKILDHSETLHKDDFCRIIVQTGDEGGFNTTYKPDKYNPMKWQRVLEEMPAWINKTISDFSYHVWYEYAREIKC